MGESVIGSLVSSSFSSRSTSKSKSSRVDSNSIIFLWACNNRPIKVGESDQHNCHDYGVRSESAGAPHPFIKCWYTLPTGLTFTEWEIHVHVLKKIPLSVCKELVTMLALFELYVPQLLQSMRSCQVAASYPACLLIIIKITPWLLSIWDDSLWSNVRWIPLDSKIGNAGDELGPIGAYLDVPWRAFWHALKCLDVPSIGP